MISFADYADAIADYCAKNGLSFAKAKQMGRSSGKNDLYLQHLDPEKGRHGLLDETPAPVVLIMKVKNGKPLFEQTEYTRKYLA